MRGKKYLSLFLILFISLIALMPLNVSADVVNGKWELNGEFYKNDGTRVLGLFEVLFDNGVSRMYKFNQNSSDVYTGWARDPDSGERFYYNYGSRITGWRKIKGLWYHFDKDGKMSSGNTYLNGKLYVFEENGIWTGKYAASGKRPDDFQFSFRYGIGFNNIDSKANIITKDLIELGNKTVSYTVPQRDLQVIYASILEFGIIEMCGLGYDITSENIAKANNENEAVSIEPCGKYVLTFVIDGKEYKLTGDDSVINHPIQNDTADVFEAFVKSVINYIQQTDAYKSLPDAVGGYD